MKERDVLAVTFDAFGFTTVTGDIRRRQELGDINLAVERAFRSDDPIHCRFEGSFLQGGESGGELLFLALCDGKTVQLLGRE